jgi:hypothetical protein
MYRGLSFGSRHINVTLASTRNSIAFLKTAHLKKADLVKMDRIISKYGIQEGVEGRGYGLI